MQIINHPLKFKETHKIQNQLKQMEEKMVVNNTEDIEVEKEDKVDEMEEEIMKIANITKNQILNLNMKKNNKKIKGENIHHQVQVQANRLKQDNSRDKK